MHYFCVSSVPLLKQIVCTLQLMDHYKMTASTSLGKVKVLLLFLAIVAAPIKIGAF
jgi:hypothetical protein